MKTYCISDIHGRYDLLVALLEEIQLKNEDTLYILGDILDRGANPIKIITKLMEMPNAVCIVGNHEMMALECLKFLMQEVTDTNLEQLDEKMLDKLMTWQYNGADTTIDEFRKLNREMQQLVLEFLEEFLPYEEVTVKGKNICWCMAVWAAFIREKKCMIILFVNWFGIGLTTIKNIIRIQISLQDILRHKRLREIPIPDISIEKIII